MISLVSMPDEFVFDVIKPQSGMFSLKQGNKYGLSEKTVKEFERLNVFEHECLDIFRVKIYPEPENYDLILAGLLSEQKLTISHVSALAYYDLTQEVPYRLEVTSNDLSTSKNIPDFLNIRTHQSKIEDHQRVDTGGFFVTSETRTIFDCIVSHSIQYESSIELLESGLFNRNELTKGQSIIWDEFSSKNEILSGY